MEERNQNGNNRRTRCSAIPQELLSEIGQTGAHLVFGIPCERSEGERRLVLTPEAVDMLTDRGHRVIVESGAGLGISYSDNHYSEAGAEIVDTPNEVYQADIILKVLPPLLPEIEMMKPRATLLSSVQFNIFSQESFEMMMTKRITGIAFEMLADEQKHCPVLNLISEIEGATAISVASELLSNSQGGKGVLLGGIPGVSPTEVVIIGAGNAGTVAARAAMSLGALVKVFDDDINKLRAIQQTLGQGLFTSTFHPNVLQNAFRSADVVIGAMRYINAPHRYVIAEDMIRIMKKGAVVIDLRVNQGGCFETTCGLSSSDPKVFEQYGVLHYCRQNVSNYVACTTSMALSNVFVPMLFSMGDFGGVINKIKCDAGFRSGVYMLHGKPVNGYVASNFNVPYNNIDIYLAAF